MTPKERVRQIFAEWDPEGLIKQHGAPPDEYYTYADEVYDAAVSSEPDQLARLIAITINRAFWLVADEHGQSYFYQQPHTTESCLATAKKVLEVVS